MDHRQKRKQEYFPHDDCNEQHGYFPRRTSVGMYSRSRRKNEDNSYGVCVSNLIARFLPRTRCDGHRGASRFSFRMLNTRTCRHCEISGLRPEYSQLLLSLSNSGENTSTRQDERIIAQHDRSHCSLRDGMASITRSNPIQSASEWECMRKL